MAELATLYKQYKAAKLTADQAAKEEDKLKKALKKAMEEAGVKSYTALHRCSLYFCLKGVRADVK